jgi:hypothetical protein
MAKSQQHARGPGESAPLPSVTSTQPPIPRGPATGPDQGRASAAENATNRQAARGSAGGIRVEAVNVGYYGHERKRVGDVFTIASMDEFSDADHDRFVEEEVTGDYGRVVGSATAKIRTRRRRLQRGWMRLVDPQTPERTTTPNQAIAQQHDEILRQRMVEQNPGAVGSVTSRPTGEANPLGDDDADLDDKE